MSPRESGAPGAGLPIAPSLSPALAGAHVTPRPLLVDRRVVVISGYAILIALAAGLSAQLLGGLIALFTNVAFYGRFSSAPSSPAGHRLGAWVIAVPALGGLLVGLMARFGSKAIRGHGIPEAMEQVLTNESRVPARMTFLKPLSAAISIGTGGPFGAEGPIIATGGALGSLFGQLVRTSAAERKTLLAAGAAAGMAATFGSPVSALLLAVELLLFEYRPRSLIPVALAAATATGLRISVAGSAPMFELPALVQPGGAALASYIVLGALVGVVSVGVTRAVYAVEDAFERLPIHWMWWPSLGGLAVGGIGYLAPDTLGVGYENIERMLSGRMLPQAVLGLCALKFASWAISLGSGTSGGTLAPLFTIGGGAGAALGAGLATLAPQLGLDVRIAALVGMAALFAGASRALLTSVIFAFETTRQPIGLLPLFAGCSAAFLVSCLLMRNSIMTEKIVRRGVRALGEYTADYLAQMPVRGVGLKPVVTLRAEDALAAARSWLDSQAAGTSHQGFPLLDAGGRLLGLLTRRDLFAQHPPETPLRELVRRACVVLPDDATLRDAADLMARERIGRIPIVSRTQPERLVGIVTRSDLVDAHVHRLRAQQLPTVPPRRR